MKRHFTFVSLFVLVALSAAHESAAEIIKLRCSFEVEGHQSEQTVYFDENQIITGKSPEKKRQIKNEKGTDSIIITIDSSKYFKINYKKTVLSTNKAENKFGDWGTDIDLTTNFILEENTFYIYANMKSKKHGYIEITETIHIDRVSGMYKKTIEFRDKLGFPETGKPYSIDQSFGYQEEAGICERYTRKF